MFFPIKESSIFLSVFLASLEMSLWPFFLELLMEQAMVSFQYAITLKSLSRASVCSSVDGAITKPPSGRDEERTSQRQGLCCVSAHQAQSFQRAVGTAYFSHPAFTLFFHFPLGATADGNGPNLGSKILGQCLPPQP